MPSFHNLHTDAEGIKIDLPTKKWLARDFIAWNLFTEH